MAGTRVVDKPLNEDQMIGEALAIVMGTTREVINHQHQASSANHPSVINQSTVSH
jgi:hypothetical protein